MVTTNFTLKGQHATVIARLYLGKPVFDLDVCNGTLIIGAEYKDFHERVEEIRKELEELTCYWQEAGRKLEQFDLTWRAKEEAEHGVPLPDRSEG